MSEIWCFTSCSTSFCEAERDDSNIDDPSFWTDLRPRAIAWSPRMDWLERQLELVQQEEIAGWCFEETEAPPIRWVYEGREERDFCWTLRLTETDEIIVHARCYPMTVE